MFVEGDKQIQLPDGTFDFLFGIASDFRTEVMWSDTRDYTVVYQLRKYAQEQMVHVLISE